jgi:arylsulfatase
VEDDIGITNLSCYSDGLMGYETPNIDRLAKEGLRFLHYYGEQSCTAGRAAFLTGQHGIRTGLTKVGFPGAPMGMSQLDPSIGGLLKSLGYATGLFGKNHVGDRNDTLPRDQDRRLQVRLCGTAFAWHDGGLGRTFYSASSAEDLQPVSGSS